MEMRVCGNCGENFAVYEQIDENTPQKNCPKCASLRRARRTGVVQTRKCLEEYRGVQIITDLPTWNDVRSRAGHSLKSVTKGSQGGASWSGRIDIWARGFDKAPTNGDFVNIRLMESSVEPKPEMVEARLEKYAGVISRQAGDDPAKIEEVTARFKKELSQIEKRRYIVLEPATPNEDLDEEERNAHLMLVFESAYSKVTLKGFGRQFRSSINTENVISVLGSAAGGARSGRFGTEYILAVVSPDHPLVMKFFEKGEVTTTMYPPLPQGIEMEPVIEPVEESAQ